MKHPLTVHPENGKLLRITDGACTYCVFADDPNCGIDECIDANGNGSRYEYAPTTEVVEVAGRRFEVRPRLDGCLQCAGEHDYQTCQDLHRATGASCVTPHGIIYVEITPPPLPISSSPLTFSAIEPGPVEFCGRKMELAASK